MHHRPDMKRRTKAGVTLVEVMLAGAITFIITTSTVGGFSLAAKIAHENANTLNIDNIAFDLMWRAFNSDYENLKTLPIKATDDTDSPYRNKTGADPLVADASEYPQYKYKLKVEENNGVKFLTLKLYTKDYSGTGEGDDTDDPHFLQELTAVRSDMPR